MKTTTEISSEWTDYDRLVAESHICNYGIIYLDEYGYPIDNEELIEEIREGGDNSWP